MNIINVGDPRTISLLAGQTISVTTTGTITATCVSGLGLTAGATIGSIHGSTVFGSYSADGVIKLTATNRDGAYELNTDTSAAIKSVTGATGLDVLDAGSKGALANSGVVGGITTKRNDIALLLGDSNVNRGFTTSDVTRASNWFHVANCMAGAPYYPVNGGVDGETTEQILVRIPALIAAHSPALICFGPNSVNDVSNAWTPERSIAAIGDAFDLAFASGAVVIIQTIHDGTLASPLSAAASNYHRKWYKAVNSFIRNYAATHAVYLHDFEAVFNDPTSGNAKAGFSQNGDGRHLSFRGAAYMGKSLYDRVLSKIPAVNKRLSSRFDPRNLLAPFGAVVGNNATTVNGFLLGTGATGTGPNAWQFRRDTGDTVSTIDGTAGTTANTADAGIGGNKVTLTITAGADAKGGGFAIPQNGVTKRFTNARANTTAYTFGDRIAIDTTRSATVFTAGTSAGTAADFTGLVAGDTLVDGTVTWMVTDRPKPGDKIRALFDFDATLSSGSGGFFMGVTVTDAAGTTTFTSFCLAATASDFTAYGPYPDFSPFTSRSTFRHEFTIPAGTAEVGECSLRPFFVGANGSAMVVNAYGASMEIIT